MHEPWIHGIIKRWSTNVQGEDLYEVIIHEDKSVTSAYGRFAHSSGSRKVSWTEFISGEMNDLVSKMMGNQVLNEVKACLREQITQEEK